MTIWCLTNRSPSRRGVLGLGVAGLAAAAVRPARARARSYALGCRPRPTIRPSLPKTALRQKLFEKEGIKAELTVYRGGAEVMRRWRRAPPI